MLIVKDKSLQRTGRECHNCEDGEFLRDGYELICDTCSYSPDKSGSRSRTSEWELHRRQVYLRATGKRDGRPRLVGGYPDAYWGGDGAYEYSPKDGSFFF